MLLNKKATKNTRYPPEVLKDMLQATYNEEAESYDKERYEERPHDVRLMRMVKNLLPKYIVGNTVLELASGTGYWGEYITSLGYNYRGIELTDRMVKISREKGLVVSQGDVEDIHNYSPCDTVVCIKAFGFFPNPIKVLHNIRMSLNPGGRFINFYYNCRYRNAIVRLYSLFKDPDIISYQPPWDERYTWKQYKELCAQAGFRVTYMRDCVVLPYKIIPKRLHGLADKLDNRLKHFGFVTMAVSEVKK